MPNKFFTLVFVFCFSLTALCQSNRRDYVFGEHKSKVLAAKKIVFYGYDMGLVSTTVRERDFLQQSICEKIMDIPAWLYAKFPPREIERLINLGKITFDPDAVQHLNLDRIRRCTSLEIVSINKEAIAARVKAYRLPEKHNGEIGFVGVPENLVKDPGYASVFFVFFDIESKEILYGGHCFAKHSGGNTIRSFYGEAIQKALRYFVRHGLNA